MDLQDSHRRIHLDGPFHLFTGLISSFPTDDFVVRLTAHFSSHPQLKFVLVRDELDVFSVLSSHSMFEA